MHLGKLVSAHGFSRIVAIKRLHPGIADEPGRMQRLLREAKLAARVVHPNVVQTLDIVEEPGMAGIVMEFVLGAPLSLLLREGRKRQERLPPSVVSAIVFDALRGLHAAHEARSEEGEPLQIVHRDVSPQNILVSKDGKGLVLDFGIAKALGTGERSLEGEIKGKLCYMPREQLLGHPVTRQADIYALGVVLWEALTGRSMHDPNEEPGRLVVRILAERPPPLRAIMPELGEGVEQVAMRALSPLARDRFATAEEMAEALEEALPPASPREVASQLSRLASEHLERQAELVSDAERLTTNGDLAGGVFPQESPADPSFGGNESTDRDPMGSRARGWGWAGGAVALMVVASLSALAAFRWRSQPSPLPAPSQELATAPPDDPPVPAIPSPTSTSSPPAISESAAAESTGARELGPRHLVGHAASRHGVPVHAAPTSTCDVPYSVDANGQKHYKEACLK